MHLAQLIQQIPSLNSDDLETLLRSNLNTYGQQLLEHVPDTFFLTKIRNDWLVPYIEERICLETAHPEFSREVLYRNQYNDPDTTFKTHIPNYSEDYQIRALKVVLDNQSNPLAPLYFFPQFDEFRIDEFRIPMTAINRAMLLVNLIVIETMSETLDDGDATYMDQMFPGISTAEGRMNLIQRYIPEYPNLFRLCDFYTLKELVDVTYHDFRCKIEDAPLNIEL